MSPSASEIDEEAALWAVRIDARGADAEQDPELEAWLAGDPRRAGALLRAQAAISFLDRGRALAGSTPLQSPSSNRRALIMAGAVLAALAGGGLWRLRPQRLNTGLGEIRRVPLADGSMVAINTSSALEVDLKPKAREISLKQGEAWFQVAKDPERPFVVAAGPVRVRAVGTAFSVHRREQEASGVDIMVTEGVVEAWVEGVDAPRHRLAAGDRLVLGGAAATPVAESASDIERSLAWRNGEIALDGESLDEAAKLFNRYNSRQIVIEDPDLAKERFVGLFQTNAPESFASAVAATLGAKVRVDEQAIRIGRSKTS